MINELSHLSKAIKDASIETESWHPKYLTIPRIKPDAPCIRIILKGGKVHALCSVSPKIGKTIRKYGDNQGSFPAMNLAPLFRITNESIAARISETIKSKGVGIERRELDSWCTENNWNSKFIKKYRISICDRALMLKKETRGSYEPLNELIDVIYPFNDAGILYNEIRDTAFKMIEDGEDVLLALQILFYVPSPKKLDDYGTLSVIFDCWELEIKGVSTVSPKFTRGVNIALLDEASDVSKVQKSNKVDAFGLLYSEPIRTMPKVALPVGFDVTLRTMFSGQPCQYRYYRCEGDSYPLSHEKGMEIKTSLEWLTNESNKSKTWVKTGKSESFFAYPSRISKVEANLSFVHLFSENSVNDEEAEFVAIAENFIEFIYRTKQLDPDNYPEFIHVFAINKYDKARTRIAYSRCATPDTVITQSQLWQAAAKNIPTLWRMSTPRTMFPLSVAIVQNRKWKKNGVLVNDKYRRTSRYHGVDLFFGVTKSVLIGDLRDLVHNSENMIPYVYTALHERNYETNSVALFQKNLKETVSLMGMYLYWMGIGKDDYMSEYPYLYGQLLKISDAVHELYCMRVRKEQMPTQLIGSAMYSAATEMPLQTLALLGTRIQPYLAWCKANRSERIDWTDKDGKLKRGLSAGFYLRQYEIIADKLKIESLQQRSFTETDKAILFIGYLASFERVKKGCCDNGEETEGENGND